MDRCIYADDIKNAIDGVTRNYLSTLSTTADAIDSVTAKWLYKRLRTLVDEMPTADVVERKVGKWVDEPVYRDGETWTGYTYCSECKEMLHEYGYRSKFCPNCGAEMKGGKDE